MAKMPIRPREIALSLTSCSPFSKRRKMNKNADAPVGSPPYDNKKEIEEKDDEFSFLDYNRTTNFILTVKYVGCKV